MSSTADPPKQALEASIRFEGEKKLVRVNRHGLLEVELSRVGSTITCRVTAQTDDLRGIDEPIATYTADGKEYAIESHDFPELDGPILIVRGDNNEMDDRVFSWGYRTESDAVAAEFAFRVMVAAISEVQR